jgi:hypothetical protein
LTRFKQSSQHLKQRSCDGRSSTWVQEQTGRPPLYSPGRPTLWRREHLVAPPHFDAVTVARLPVLLDQVGLRGKECRAVVVG